MGKPSAVPLGAQRKVEKGQPPVQCCSHLATVSACADHWRGRFDSDIASQARARVEENFAVTFASTKILVQTQWEAVRFDRVKHTAGTLLEVFSAAVKPAASAIGLSGAITLRAAAD